MEKNNSQLEASIISKKDFSASQDGTVSTQKTSEVSKDCFDRLVIEDRRRVTLPKFPEDLTDIVRHSDKIKKSSEDKDRQKTCKCVVRLLVLSTFILGIGFGLGWWYGSSSNDVQMDS